MIAFRAERVAVLAAALALASVTARAQDEGAPLRLVPLPGPAPEAQPLAAPEEAGPAQPAPAAGEPEISIGRLEEVGVDAFGLLAPGDGGLGPELWQGADGKRIIDLFARLPAGAPSPAMLTLARRLLLTSAPAPRAVAEEGAFLAARAATLARLGAPADAARLIAALPTRAAMPRMRLVEADALFAAGAREQACALARAEIRTAPTLAWQKALAVCQALAGETEPARLSLTLVREQAGEDDAAYLALAEQLLGERVDAGPSFTSGLEIAMTLAAKAAPEAAAVAGLPPAAARALASDPDSPVETRLAAGERAARLGALAPDELAELYMLPAFADDELAAAAGSQADMPGPLGRALLFQASRAQQPPDRRAALLDALWAAGGEGPGFGVLARAAGVSLLTIAPDRGVAWFAPAAVRALVAAGRAETAQAWYLALAEVGALEPQALAAQKGALPVLAAAGIGMGRQWEPAMAGQWWRGLPEGPDPGVRAETANRVLMLLDALGVRMGPEVWDLFAEAPARVVEEVPNLGIRYGMRDAAQAGRRGETVLYALISLGDGGAIGAGALSLGSVVRSLRAVGLEDDARALALEALIEVGR